jgi:hypothetical protein
MNKASEKLLQKIMKEFIGYWNVDDALLYTSKVFPFCDPDEHVRDALKALACKKDKDERFRLGQRAIEEASENRNVFRDIEYFMDRFESRYRKRSPEADVRDYRDMMMMVLPTLISQKGNVSVSLDVNKLMELVYKECDTCPIRDICKEAFSICSEYIGISMRELNIDIPSSDD